MANVENVVRPQVKISYVISMRSDENLFTEFLFESNEILLISLTDFKRKISPSPHQKLIENLERSPRKKNLQKIFKNINFRKSFKNLKFWCLNY